MILRRALLVPTSRRETGVWIAVSRFQKRDNIHRANGILPGFLPGIDAGDDSVLQIVLGCFLGNLAQPIELLLVDDLWVGIPDHHPAIVDKELFEKVQAVQRRFSLPTKKTREYPLKGKVYCGCCDHALSRIAQKRPFYMCRHSTADVNSRCRDVRADVAGLEEAVLLTLKKQLEILLPVHKDGTIHLEATAAKCSEYEKQLEALKDQKQALFERYLLGQIELDTYKSEKAVYDAEILKVKNAYAAVTAQAKLKREEQARQSSRQEIVHSIAEADVLTSELTDLLIEKVYVFPDNRIEIIYKVHDLFE